MATRVISGAYSKPLTPLRPKPRLLSPSIPAVTVAFTGTGTLTATVVPTTKRTTPFAGTGTLTADISSRTTAVTTALFTGTGTLTATAIPTTAVTDTISRIRGAATPLPVMGVTAGPAVTGFEPFTLITITATITGTTTSGVTYSLVQTMGPPTAITGTGPTWTYRTPGVPTTQNVAQTRFTITATKTGYTTTTCTIDHYIYPAPAMDYDNIGAPRGLSIQA